MKTLRRAKHLLLPATLVVSALATASATNVANKTETVLAEQFSFSAYPPHFGGDLSFSHDHAAIHTDVYYTEQQPAPAHRYNPETVDQLQNQLDREVEAMLDAKYPAIQLALNW